MDVKLVVRLPNTTSEMMSMRFPFEYLVGSSDPFGTTASIAFTSDAGGGVFRDNIQIGTTGTPQSV